MRVVVAVVALLAGGVNRHVCGHAVTVHQLAGEVVRQLFPLCGGKLGGQGYFKLAGYRRVFALLGLLGGVPELGAVACPLGGVVRQDDGGRFNATLAGVVVNLAGALVGNLAPSAIGSGGGRTATSRTADGLNAEVKDCHGAGSGCWFSPEGAHANEVCISAPFALASGVSLPGILPVRSAASHP